MRSQFQCEPNLTSKFIPGAPPTNDRGPWAPVLKAQALIRHWTYICQGEKKPTSAESVVQKRRYGLVVFYVYSPLVISSSLGSEDGFSNTQKDSVDRQNQVARVGGATSLFIQRVSRTEALLRNHLGRSIPQRCLSNVLIALA